jgi:hypothetical protein
VLAQYRDRVVGCHTHFVAAVVAAYYGALSVPYWPRLFIQPRSICLRGIYSPNAFWGARNLFTCPLWRWREVLSEMIALGSMRGL